MIHERKIGKKIFYCDVHVVNDSTVLIKIRRS